MVAKTAASAQNGLVEYRVALFRVDADDVKTLGDGDAARIQAEEMRGQEDYGAAGGPRKAPAAEEPA